MRDMRADRAGNMTGQRQMPQITESTLRGLVDRHYQAGGIPARYFYLVYMQVGCQGPSE